MHKRLLSFTLLAGAAMTIFSADAARVNPAQALERLIKSASPLSNGAAGAHAATLELAYTVNDSATSIPGVYVFTSADNSFILAPADDLAPALLGYGDNFDPDDIPDNFRWWMQNYARQIQYLSEHPEAAPEALSDHATIPHLLTTTWNQRAPYNNLCPSDAGGRSVTGCVATAMAQVINYHECPAAYGTGTHSYTWNNTTLSFDYSATRFDWANMRDSYSGSYTTAQANAVATLMYAAGVGVNMNYSSKESGAVSLRIPATLVNNFGFAPSARFVSRDCFTAADWDALIYNELAARRPVIYSGQSQQGGHCFVCDGYDGNSYYHINWGWGGLSDGSFLLSALDPYQQGTGGSGNNTGFNTDQDAIIGVQAPGSDIVPAGLSLIANGGFAYSDTYKGFWWGQNKGFFNYSASPAEFYTGIKLVNRSTGETFYAQGEKMSLNGISDAGSLDGYSLIRAAMPAGLPAGYYDAYPVARDLDSDEWQKIYIPVSLNQSVEVRVGNNGLVTFDGSDPDQISSFIAVTEIYQSRDITPTSPYSYLYVTVSNSGSESVTNGINFNFKNTATGETVTIGTWNLKCDAASKNYYSLTMESFFDRLPDGKYEVTAFNTTVGATVSDPYTIYIGVQPKSVTVTPKTLTLVANETYSLTASVTPADAFDTSVTWTSSDSDVASVAADGTVKAIANGTALITATTINGLTSSATVTVSGSAGVDAILPDNGSEGAEILYDLRGVKVENPSAPGLYIRISGGKPEKVIR